MKVLLIEDDREIVDAISLAFKIRWPEATLISTRLGQKGVEFVESESPDIVILALGLPDINGFEVLQQIRLFSQVPTIILTVRSDEADIVKGLEWGADEQLVLTEALNRPYEATFEIRTDQMDVEPSRLLGSNATILIERGDSQQRCPGLISEVLEGNATGDYISVHITLVPALTLLDQRRDTRIFQGMSVPEILEQVVSETLGEYEREVRMTSDDFSGFFTWSEQVEVDGVIQNVTSSDLDDEDEVVLVYPRGQLIVHDPKIGIIPYEPWSFLGLGVLEWAVIGSLLVIVSAIVIVRRS